MLYLSFLSSFTLRKKKAGEGNHTCLLTRIREEYTADGNTLSYMKEMKAGLREWTHKEGGFEKQLLFDEAGSLFFFS